MAAQPPVLQPTADPLAELREIHLPAALPGGLEWPPPLGWWLAALLLAAALVCGWWWWQARRYRREALAELKALLAGWQADGDDREYLTRLQSLLKRTALSGFPREQVAGLTGEAWVNFLDRSAGRYAFSMDEAEALIDGGYRPDARVPVAKLHRKAAAWIRGHHPKHLKQQTGLQPAGGAA